MLLLCLKVRYPDGIYLIRGNHEDREVNEVFGFLEECNERLPQAGTAVWDLANQVFDCLPLAALVEEAVLCMHGGIGETLQSLQQILNIPRPLPQPCRSEFAAVMRDLLWSDPTDNDTVVGVHANTRGEETRTFGPDRVQEFLQLNGEVLIFMKEELSTDFFCGEERGIGDIEVTKIE